MREEGPFWFLLCFAFLFFSFLGGEGVCGCVWVCRSDEEEEEMRGKKWVEQDRAGEEETGEERESSERERERRKKQGKRERVL